MAEARFKLVVILDEDMQNQDDAAMIAEEIDRIDGVAEVEGMGWNPWEGE